MLTLAKRSTKYNRASVSYFSHLVCAGERRRASTGVWTDHETRRTFRPSAAPKLWERASMCQSAAQGRKSGDAAAAAAAAGNNNGNFPIHLLLFCSCDAGSAVWLCKNNFLRRNGGFSRNGQMQLVVQYTRFKKAKRDRLIIL